MGGFLSGDVAWSPFRRAWREPACRADVRRVSAGRLGGPGCSGMVLRGLGLGVFRLARLGALARVMTAGAVRVTVSFGLAWPNVLGDLDLRARCRSRPVTVRYPAICLASACVAGPSGADRGEDEAAGAGQGQVAAADGEPGAASLLRGSGVAGGVAGDAAGHLGGGGPGRDLLGDQGRGCRSGASPRCPARPRAAAPSPPAARSPTRPTAIYRARPAPGPGTRASRGGR